MKRFIAPVMTLVLLAGCAGENATDEFKDLERRVGPKTGLPHVAQATAKATAYKLDVVDPGGLIFLAGQEATFELQAHVISGLKYSIALRNEPKGMKLTTVDESGKLSLTWKPSADQIPFGKPTDEMTVEFVLAYDAKTSTPEAVEAFTIQKQSQTQSEKVLVKRDLTQPTVKIVETTAIPATVDEGAKFTFAIEVTDVAADAKNPPRVSFSKVEGIDASVFIRDDLKAQGLKQTKPGVWTGTRVFEADLSSLPDGVKSANKIGEANASFQAHFGYVVISANGKDAATPVRTVTFQLNKDFAAPKLKVTLPKNSTAKRGVKNTLTILAESLNKRAEVVIDIAKLTTSLAALPNNPVLDCPTKKSTYLQTCTVSWTVDCSASDLQPKYTFSVEATTSLFGEKKVTTVDQEIKLAPVCPKPAPAKKAGKK